MKLTISIKNYLSGQINGFLQWRMAVVRKRLASSSRILTEYVAIHFNAEENLMRKRNYTDYLQHQIQHKQFTADVFHLKQEFETQGATSDLVIQMHKKVCNWLRNRISTEDKKFGAYLAK